MDKIGDDKLIGPSSVVIAQLKETLHRAQKTLRQAERQIQRSRELMDQSDQLGPRRV